MGKGQINTAMAHTISASAYSAYGGVTAVSGVVNAPAMGRAAMNVARANPGAVRIAIDFTESAITPYAPATTSAGVAGALAGHYGPSLVQSVAHNAFSK